MAEDRDRLLTLGQAFRDHVISVFDEMEVELPSMRYLTTGAAVADCEALVVSFAGMDPGRPGVAAVPDLLSCIIERTATLQATVFRCAPAGAGQRPPTTTQQEAYGEVSLRDAWALERAGERVSAILDEGYKLFTFVLNPTERTGGFGGMMLEVTVAL